MRRHVPPERRPIPTLVHHARPARAVHPPAPDALRLHLLERAVRAAEHGLAEVAQAVLDVVRERGAADLHADADDVETVQLVHHRELERAPRGPDAAEAVGLEQRAPLGVVREQPVRRVRPRQPDARHVDRELRRVVVADPR